MLSSAKDRLPGSLALHGRLEAYPTTQDGLMEQRKFAFGENWSSFLEQLDPQRIEVARQSMVDLLSPAMGCEAAEPEILLKGKRFLDAGSGSGLFSLSAVELGADVVSFDVDDESVSCTQTLCDRFAGQASWDVQTGSLLDASFMESLGQYDVVYCWGVAHHTGEMWKAIDHLCDRVNDGGTMVLAIYNDQGYVSQIWGVIKRTYQRLPKPLRPVLALLIGAVLFMKRFAVTGFASVFRVATLKNPLVPFTNWMSETQGRGMHVWHDLVDWVGGWPFGVARPEEVFRSLRDRGFELEELVTCDGHGCNEFVFRLRR